MRKRLLSLTLAAAMAFSLAGCRSTEPVATEAPTIDAAPAITVAEGGETDATEETEIEVLAADFEIGIIIGTASQGDEEIIQANKIRGKYGDMIVTSTYSDSFSTETETVISNAVTMAPDPAVKAIVWCQAIPGTAAVIDKVHETRPGIIFIASTPDEDPGVINPKADIVLRVDEPGRGIVIPLQVKAQGAKIMIHYSFSRHMSYALIVARHENLKKYCAENDIELVDVIVPDSTGDSGITGVQQSIFEDVPRQIEKYGKDTVFFTISCGIQEPLIHSVLEQGVIHSLQRCPSPFRAFPVALSIGMAGHEADVDYMLDQFQAKVDEAGMNGRVSIWGVPRNMLFAEADVEYAKKVSGEQANGVVPDDQILHNTLQEYAGEIQMTIDNYVDDSGNAKDNHYLVMADFVTFE